MIEIFHSMPLRGLTEEQIRINREWQHKAVDNFCKDVLRQDYMILPTYIQYNPPGAKALWYLGEGIKSFLVYADYLLLAPDWREARGCRCEQFVAKEYGISCVQIDSLNGFTWITKCDLSN